MRTKGTQLSDTAQALISLEGPAQIALTVTFTVLSQSLHKMLSFYQGQNNGIYGTWCSTSTKSDEVTEDTVNN